MRSLFFRIFIWFWGAVVLLAVTFAAFIVTTRFTESREHMHAFRRAMALSAKAAAVNYERAGVEGLREVIGVRDASQNYIFFFDKQPAELQGLSVPDDAQILARTVLAQSPQRCMNRAGWIGCGTTGSSGAPYVLVMRFRLGLLVSPTEWAVLIPALMTAAGLVCFWLARYLTQPISRLRRLTGRFADGDLHARVEDYADFAHSEELQGLAHDFDRMAERIQALIERQKHLLWDISHELRTPLTRIGLAIGLVRQRVPDLPPKEFNRVDREIERLNQLIGQILTIARLESGTRQEDRQMVDMRELVEEVAGDGGLEADVEDITIRVECERPVRIHGSRELLRAAIENVLRNAIRHAPPASAVTIQLAQAEDKISLTICDQGPGVSEGDLPHLFEPFFRSADARMNDPGGTGLGLAMTRRIVEWHGGSVTAQNRKPAGLLVTMEFPVKVASSEVREITGVKDRDLAMSRQMQ
jgi:signal transduction histidine kinase